jgi:hypothetical protein
MRDPGDENDSIEARLDALWDRYWAAKQAGFLDQAVKLNTSSCDANTKRRRRDE